MMNNSEFSVAFWTWQIHDSVLEYEHDAQEAKMK